MTRIQTFTGEWITPLDPPHGNINIVDIAHSLAMTCRFSGHCRRFYSVAEHSIIVSEMAEQESKELARWGLLHDASEAYLPDVARPIKSFFAGFKQWEESLLQAVADTFNLPWPMPGLIKAFDAFALRAEASLLMRDEEWQINDYVDSYTVDLKRDPSIIGANPYVARELFLKRFLDLFPDEEIPSYDFV